MAVPFSKADKTLPLFHKQTEADGTEKASMAAFAPPSYSAFLGSGEYLASMPAYALRHAPMPSILL